MEKNLKSLLDIIVYDQYFFYVGLGFLILLLFILLILIIKSSNKKVKQPKPVIEPVVLEEEPKENEMDLEVILNKMSQELENNSGDLKRFEDEQEQKAIISYQELKKNALEKDEKQQEIEKTEEPQLEMDKVEEPKKEIKPEIDLDFTIIDSPKKFKNSEVLSPIYGRMSNNVSYSNIKNKDEQIMEEPQPEVEKKEEPKQVDIVSKSDEFLDALKEFRKNLE